jgi:4-hydroxybenzoyl-CoA thioesterase
MAKVFSVEYPVLFSHCDPAGIAYFPRLFDLLHQAMEAWFNDGLDERYADLLMKKRIGAPTVSMQCDFISPAFFGDRLNIELSVVRIRNSAIDLAYHATIGERVCLKARHSVCIFSLETYKAIPIPDALRERVQAYLAEEAAESPQQ